MPSYITSYIMVDWLTKRAWVDGHEIQHLGGCEYKASMDMVTHTYIYTVYTHTHTHTQLGWTHRLGGPRQVRHLVGAHTLKNTLFTMMRIGLSRLHMRGETFS